MALAAQLLIRSVVTIRSDSSSWHPTPSTPRKLQLYAHRIYSKIVPEREYFRWSYFPDYEELVPQQRLEKYKNISFLFNPDKRYHEEFEGFDAEYESGTLPNGGVKQADVVLLNYPLMWDMPDDVKRNDLELYEGITDANGPAMTWSIFAIKWVSFYNISSMCLELQFSRPRWRWVSAATIASDRYVWSC